MKNRIYLASGWFTKDQKKSMGDVHKLLGEMGVSHYAPFWDGIVLQKESLPEHRRQAFVLDLGELHYCKLMVAVTDDFDPGTIWEMGQFFPKPIIAYTSVPHRGINIMLSESVIAFANGVEELKNVLSFLDRYIIKPMEWSGEAF